LTHREKPVTNFAIPHATWDRYAAGPAPTIIRRTDLGSLMDEYERIAAEIEADPVAKQRLGWVREMYAYDLAAAILGVEHRWGWHFSLTLFRQPGQGCRLGCTHSSWLKTLHWVADWVAGTHSTPSELSSNTS
jgi:hypothetical protein